LLILSMDAKEESLVPTSATLVLVSDQFSSQLGPCTPGCSAVDQTPGPLHDKVLKEADSFLVRA
jgi:hypothetical protein